MMWDEPGLPGQGAAAASLLGGIDLLSALGHHVWYRVRPPHRRTTPPLRICLDVSAGQRHHPTGLERYGLLLAQSLIETDCGNDYTLLLDKRSPLPISPGRARVRRLRFPVTLFERLAGAPEIELAAGPVDVFHCQLGFTPRFSFGAMVATLHDVILLQMPTDGSPPRKDGARTHFADLAQRATLVVTGTHVAARDISTELGIPLERFRVVPHAPDPRFEQGPTAESRQRARIRSGLEGPYALAVGTLFPHKNHVRLVRAFSRIAASVPHTLAIAGGPGTCEAAVTTAIEDAGLGGRVRLLGYVADEDVPPLMADADLFVQPSLLEGFGLPVLDAMAIGTPVACANASALPEVAGEAAEYFDPNDVDSMADVLGKLLQSAERRDVLRAAGGKRAAEFSWAETARLTAEVYREAAALGQRRPNNGAGA